MSEEFLADGSRRAGCIPGAVKYLALLEFNDNVWKVMTIKDCEANDLLPSVTGMELWPLFLPQCHIF